MNNQHTRGPWSVSNVDSDPDYVLICADDKQANGAWEIATPHGPDAKANARLIAAAPELLEALIEIEKGEGAFSRDRILHAANVIENAKRIARGAIAKATGQS